MGIESKAIRDLEDLNDSEEAMLGTRSRMKSLYPKNTVFRVFVGCMNEDSDRLMYESLLTKSFQCQSGLKDTGDLILIEVNGTFDKEGCYHVMARYATIPEQVSK